MNIIQFLYTIPGVPLGYILYFIYKFICSNVGVAILIFTFIVKLATLPLYVKQQKSQAKSAIFMPKVREIQTKYANNREKQQAELMKLQQQGYKPTAGCGTMLLSFLILFGVIDVVYKPLTHIVHMNSAKIASVVEESYNVEFTSLLVEEVSRTDSDALSLNEAGLKKHESVVKDAQKIVDYYNENCLKEGESKVELTALSTLTTDSVKLVKTAMKSVMLNEYAENTDIVQFASTDFFGLTSDEKAEMDALETDEEKEAYRAEHAFGQYTTSALNNANIHYGSYKVASDDSVTFAATSAMQRELYAVERFGTEIGSGDNKFRCRDAYSESVLRHEVKEELSELYDNLDFLGIKLGQVPKDNMGFPMILVPIISFLMALAQTFITNRITMKNNPEQAQMAGMGPMKIMMYIMPLFSLWIAFTVPAGAGFYWAISYMFGIIQTLVLNKLYNPAKLREQAQAEWDAQHPSKKKKKKTVSVEAEKVTDVDADDDDEDDDESGKITEEESLSQKELNRRKLAEARKRQAEKYGEEYHDDSDD